MRPKQKGELILQTKWRRVFALILLIAVVAGFGVLLTSCGNSSLTYTAQYDWAEIRTASGDLIVGPVSQWTVTGPSGTLHVTINGITYLTHACNVTLMTEKP